MFFTYPINHLNQASSQLRTLVNPNEPAGIRAIAVFEGNMPGRIFTDDPNHPTWAVLQETVYGTIYPAGSVTRPVLERLIPDLCRDGELLVGLWPDDPRLPDFLSFQPEYDGRVLDFFDRPIGQGLEPYLTPIPDGCEIRPVDAALYQRLSDYDPKNAETKLERGLGVCLIRDEEILSETFAAKLTHATLEMGVTTQKPYEGRGYGTLTCAHLVQVCEARGFQTYWNCNTHNVASMKIARKLGYRTEKEYRLLYWSKSG
jgi:RimJ/RimL family protein N-acetyltransferase